MIMSAQARPNSSSVQPQGYVEKTQLIQALMNASIQQQEINMTSQHQVQQTTRFATAPTVLASMKRNFGGASLTLAPAAKRQRVHRISTQVVPQSKGWWKFGNMQRDLIRELIDKDVIRNDVSPSLGDQSSTTAMVPSITAEYKKPLTEMPSAMQSSPTTGSLPNNPIQTIASPYYEREESYSHDGSDDTSDMDDQAALRFRAYQVSNTNPSMAPSCVCL